MPRLHRKKNNKRTGVKKVRNSLDAMGIWTTDKMLNAYLRGKINFSIAQDYTTESNYDRTTWT